MNIIYRQDKFRKDGGAMFNFLKQLFIGDTDNNDIDNDDSDNYDGTTADMHEEDEQEEYYSQCYDCGKDLYYDESNWIQEYYVCNECLEENYGECVNCSSYYPLDYLVEDHNNYYNTYYCEHCYDDLSNPDYLDINEDGETNWSGSLEGRYD